MTLYRIVAKREIYAEFEVEANSEQEAQNKVTYWDNMEGNEEQYYFDWFPWEFESVDIIDNNQEGEE